MPETIGFNHEEVEKLYPELKKNQLDNEIQEKSVNNNDENVENIKSETLTSNPEKRGRNFLGNMMTKLENNFNKMLDKVDTANILAMSAFVPTLITFGSVFYQGITQDFETARMGMKTAEVMLASFPLATILHLLKLRKEGKE